MRLHRIQSLIQQQVLGVFQSLARTAIDHPRAVLLMSLVVVLGAAPGVLRLKLRTDGHALVSPRAPEVIYDKQIRDQFGIEDQLVVLVRSDNPDGIFNPATLQLVRDLTAELEKLPGVNPSNVMSLATEPSFRSRPGSYCTRSCWSRRFRPNQSSINCGTICDGLNCIRGHWWRMTENPQSF